MSVKTNKHRHTHTQKQQLGWKTNTRPSAVNNCRLLRSFKNDKQRFGSAKHPTNTTLNKTTAKQHITENAKTERKRESERKIDREKGG